MGLFGTFVSISVTGQGIEHMFFFRFQRGRIVEVWELLDRSELHRQLADE